MSKKVEKNNKQANTEKQTKARSLMSNVVGAGAAVAVAVVVLSSTVEAYFRELFVFEDTIFYTVEVVEIYDPEQGEPQNLPVRLVIEDQYDTVYIDLDYGQTSGEINNLTKNNVYRFKIQLQKDVGWITLESTSVNTYEELNGAVYELSMDDNFRVAESDLTLGVFVQKGIETISELYLEVEYLSIVQTFPLVFGDQEIIIPDFSYSDLIIETRVFAQVEDGDLIELHNKIFELRPYFPAEIRFDYIDTTTMNININENDLPFNVGYLYRVLKGDRIVDSGFLLDATTSLTLEPYQSYTFEVIGLYNRESVPLISYSMRTDAPPFAVTQILKGVGENRLTVNVFEYNAETYDRVYVMLDGEKIYLNTLQTNETMLAAEGWIPTFEGSLNIYLEIKDQPDVEYLLDTIEEG